MDLIDYIYDECQRQHVTNYGDFAAAWQYARKHGAAQHSALKFSGFVQVRERFDRWCESAYEFVDANNICDHVDGSLVDLFIKQLLDIHPWADGNGRTASILRNWMLGTLDDPEPLPYYYGGT